MKGISRANSRLRYERIAELWERGITAEDIATITGVQNAVSSARKRLGVDRVPLRHAHPKGSGGLVRKTNLISGSGIGRRYVRKISDTEYLVRDERFVEEVWVIDTHGILFGRYLRLSFKIVMGMTERRVPPDLSHIYAK